jgi:anti-sigma regulatory factor (Ser/Thr protein kinase)
MDTQSTSFVETDKIDGVSGRGFLPLTFTAVDGLAFAAAKGRLAAAPPRIYSAASVGALIELLILSRDGLLPKLEGNQWVDFSLAENLYAAYQRNDRLWVCPTTKQRALFRTSEKDSQDTAGRFCVAAEKAARSVGLSKGVARQLVAALGEMLDNVHLHSKSLATGLAAFDANAQKFEFVVADRGVGIVRSLKECNEYSELSDHGDALEFALTDGCSRYGRGTNHGHGFAPLFVGLSNLNCSLRFRTGDHALTIDGRDPKNIPWRKIAKPPIPGFLASVSIEAA